MRVARSSLLALLFLLFVPSLVVSQGNQAKEIVVKPGLHVVTLGVSDLKKSYAFYKDGLGFPTKMTPDGGIVLFTTSGAKLFLYPLDKLAADVGMTAPDGKNPGSRFTGITFGHAVDSRQAVDEILRRARKAGGGVVKPAKAAAWGGYTGYFSDPDGYLWEAAHFDGWSFSDEGALIFAE